MDAETDFCELRIVIALERIEVVGAHFGGAVASPEVVLEKYGHFLNHRGTVECGCGCNLEGGNQVFLTIGADFANRELRTGDDDGLTEIAEHE